MYSTVPPPSAHFSYPPPMTPMTPVYSAAPMFTPQPATESGSADNVFAASAALAAQAAQKAAAEAAQKAAAEAAAKYAASLVTVMTEASPAVPVAMEVNQVQVSN